MSSIPVAMTEDSGTAERGAAEVGSLDPAPTFDAFYSREFNALVAFARALTGSAVHAEDIAQEAMLIAYRRWDRVSNLDQPHAWVRRVCANLATSHLRRRVVERRALLKTRGTVADIAATLECSEGSVKRHLSRGRTALAAKLGHDEGSES